MLKTFIKKYTILLLSLFLYAFLIICEQQQCRTVFVHGLGRNKEQLAYYINSDYIENNAYSFNFCNDFLKISLGQINEINALMGNLENRLHSYDDNNDDGDIVLWGVSMGAATIINFLASIDVNYRIDMIKGLILESPFAHVQDVINGKISCNKWLTRLSYIPYATELIVKMKYPAHSLHGIQPIKCIHSIPKHIPVLFIAIEDDKIVPFASTIQLYKALIKVGHKKCHLLTLKQGEHGRLSKNEKQEHILGIVHAFRKFYNLGNYSEAWAQTGWENFLNNTQPIFE